MRAAAMAIFLVLTAARATAAPCWFDHGAIVAPAAFGDIAGDFLLDAASPRSQLHVTVAESFGLTEPAARADLRFAGRRLRGFVMEVADLGAREQPFAAGLVGVIGADALRGYAVEITTSPCEVRLLPRGRRARGAIRLPMREVGGALSVEAAISDGAMSRDGWFAVATGQPGVSVADARYTRDPPKDADPDWPPARLRALSLGGRLYENVPAAVKTDAPVGLSGAIGEEIWSRWRLTLDAGRGELELAPLRPTSGR